MAEKQLRVDLEVSSDIAKTFLPPDNEALLNSTISFRGIKKSVAINDVLCEAAPTFQRQTMKMLIPIAHFGVKGYYLAAELCHMWAGCFTEASNRSHGYRRALYWLSLRPSPLLPSLLQSKTST